MAGEVAALTLRPLPNFQRRCRASLFGKVVLDARAREVHDADRQDCEDRIVALERRGLGVLVQSGLKSI